jgi:hypothetical protein
MIFCLEHILSLLTYLEAQALELKSLGKKYILSLSLSLPPSPSLHSVAIFCHLNFPFKSITSQDIKEIRVTIQTAAYIHRLSYHKDWIYGLLATRREENRATAGRKTLI